MSAIKTFFPAVLAFSLASAALAQEDWAEYDYERNYASVQGAVVLPQGGGDMRRLGGAAFRYGYYISDFLAAEGTVAATEDTPGFAIKGLWHWWGYEKTDPFFTFGAAAFVRGDSGPVLGTGLFRHFDDNWSLRLDAGFMLGVESRTEAAFSLSCGIQYAF